MSRETFEYRPGAAPTLAERATHLTALAQRITRSDAVTLRDVEALVVARRALAGMGRPQGAGERSARARALLAARGAARHFLRLVHEADVEIAGLTLRPRRRGAVLEIPEVLDTPIQRTRPGRRGRGPSPYGLRSYRGRRFAVPEEQAVVAKLMRWKARGVSNAEVARRLGDERVPSPAGAGGWHATAVLRIVARERRRKGSTP